MARRILVATYLRTAQPAKALSTLQPVLDKIEQDSNMLALAGEVFMQNGDAEKAGDYFAKAAALDPENKAKQTSVALSRLARGDTETAYRELEQIASVDTGVRADMALISSQLRQRQFDLALKSIDALAKKQPDSPLVDQLRGTATLGKGDLTGARKNFEQALSKNPTYFPAAASLANLDLSEKKPVEAKKRFEAACAQETALIAQLRETAPDAIAGDGYPLNLRLLAQRLKDEGHAQALPHSLGLILKGLAGDGRNDHNCPDGRGSITLKRGNDPETEIGRAHV